jgi:hypothetical protein
LKFESSHPGKSDSNFHVPGEDSAVSSCAAVRQTSQKLAVQLAMYGRESDCGQETIQP